MPRSIVNGLPWGVHSLECVYSPSCDAGLPDGTWVHAVAEPYTANRLQAAWWVLTGRAYAFVWPKAGDLERVLEMKPRRRTIPMNEKLPPDASAFTITCSMKERWIPHFLGMLRYMQQLGSMGSSRAVTFFADGDGDFRPRFAFQAGLPEPAPGEVAANGEARFDAG